MAIIVRRIATSDRAAWSGLYQGYAAFYGVEQTEAMRERVWDWLHDPAHEVEGLVAEQDGAVVGIAHFRAFARPLSATVAGFLDDLFVAPELRGGGAANALLDAVAAEGRARGWSVIRWLTAENNYRARALYDRVGEVGRWRVYDIKL